MTTPNGYSINSTRSDESEDEEPLIENDAGVFIGVAGVQSIQFRFKIKYYHKE